MTGQHPSDERCRSFSGGVRAVGAQGSAEPVRKRCVRQCSVVAATGSHSLEAAMGSKDKSGKNTKTVAEKNLKEKRLDKKAKRTAAEAKRNRTV